MNSYLNQLFNLEGKVAVVIGGGGHLCSEMARGLARAGCSLAILDLRPEKAKAIEDELRKMDLNRVTSCAINVAKKEDHLKALEHVKNTLGEVDILINGAGINGPTPFLELTLEEWHSIMDSQITGTFLGCQVFGGSMVARGK